MVEEKELRGIYRIFMELGRGNSCKSCRIFIGEIIWVYNIGVIELI